MPDRAASSGSRGPARRDETIPAPMLRSATTEAAASSRQLPSDDLHGKLIVAIVEKADANAAIGVSRNDPRRRGSDQLPSFRHQNHIPLDAEGAVEDELAIFDVVRRRVGVRLENADASLAALRHRTGKMDFD